MTDAVMEEGAVRSFQRWWRGQPGKKEIGDKLINHARNQIGFARGLTAAGKMTRKAYEVAKKKGNGKGADAVYMNSQDANWERHKSVIDSAERNSGRGFYLKHGFPSKVHSRLPKFKSRNEGLLSLAEWWGRKAPELTPAQRADKERDAKRLYDLKVLWASMIVHLERFAVDYTRAKLSGNVAGMRAAKQNLQRKRLDRAQLEDTIESVYEKWKQAGSPIQVKEPEQKQDWLQRHTGGWLKW